MAAGSKGLCVGCDLVGSLPAIVAHVRSCSHYAALYVADPAAALEPAEAWRRAQASADPATPRPKVSDRPARVRDVSKAEAPAQPDPTPEAGPVAVEYWVVPTGLLTS